ncbi:hypothetical protein Ciccas_008415, partial [Cichlidogyrus casuarinus]
ENVFSFKRGHFFGDRDRGLVPITVYREGPLDSGCRIDVCTKDSTAKGNDVLKDDCDYQINHEPVLFEAGQEEAIVEVPINRSSDITKTFVATIRNIPKGSRLGEHAGAVCYLGPSELLKYTLFRSFMLHRVNLSSLVIEQVLIDEEGNSEEDPTWAQQFRMAVTIQPDVDEDGKPQKLSNLDYTMHFISFIWKIIFAVIPPRSYFGAYPTFVVSILMIGVLTAIVEQLATLLGCSASLHTAVTGITLVAVGTSLPDTFASRIAAMQDDYADNSIGNITGSNSVNVFLGLGLPWLISSAYAYAKGKQYCISFNNVFESTILFICCAIVCLSVILMRRFLGGGELGGPMKYKLFSSIIIVILWIFFLVIMSLRSYGIIDITLYVPDSSCNSA